MTGTWSTGAFFFRVDFFSAYHANFPSVPSGMNSRFQFHAVHFPSPKAQSQWTEGTEAALKRGNMASYQGDR